jgi:hypothetical protein
MARLEYDHQRLTYITEAIWPTVPDSLHYSNDVHLGIRYTVRIS